MMAMAAALFSGGEFGAIDSIEGAYAGLGKAISDQAATIFGVALLASGLASASVGTMSGQVVMQGFLDRRIPLYLRRGITLAPAIVIVALGVAPTDALVISQVVLSFGIPFALVPLLLLSMRKKVMGGLVNPRWLSGLVGLIVTPIIALNLFLLFRLFAG
jgi:manganese transport protein